MSEGNGQTGTVIEFIQGLTEKWDVTHLRVKQEGKYRTLPLSQIQDQRAILRYVKERMLEFGQTLPPEKTKEVEQPKGEA